MPGLLSAIAGRTLAIPKVEASISIVATAISGPLTTGSFAPSAIPGRILGKRSAESQKSSASFRISSWTGGIRPAKGGS